MNPEHRLIGHAIVSADGRIADADRRMPQALRNEADWRLFQAALDRAALTVLGHASHLAAPNPKARRRLILSRGVRGLTQRPDGHWLNPEDMALAAALERLVPEGGEIAVPGGQGVFDLVGASGFAAFHLATSRRVTLPGGVGLFGAVERGRAPEAVLSDGGLVKRSEALIDPEADVVLAVWERP